MSYVVRTLNAAPLSKEDQVPPPTLEEFEALQVFETEGEARQFLVSLPREKLFLSYVVDRNLLYNLVIRSSAHRQREKAEISVVQEKYKCSAYFARQILEAEKNGLPLPARFNPACTEARILRLRARAATLRTQLAEVEAELTTAERTTA
jgi:hypothetical protein